MKKLFGFLIYILFFAQGVYCGTIAFPENEVRQGFAKVNLAVESEGTWTADSLQCEILWTTLLDVTNDGTWRQLIPVYFQNGTAKVPMETFYRDNVCLDIKNKRGQVIESIGIGLHQDKPLSLTLKFDKNNHLVDVIHEGGTGRIDLSGRYSKILSDFGFTTITSAKDWEDSNRFLKWQIQSMMPENLKSLTAADLTDDERQWIESDLTRTYCATRILPYVRRAKTWGVDFVGVNPDNIKQPDEEFYRFLNDCDFSSAMLNDFSHSLRFVCSNLLQDLPVGITPIGEKSVSDWQADTKARLSQVIDNPSQLLLDLLTMTSFFNQIQYDSTPLSEAQLENVRSFYGDSEIGKIILSRNANPFPNVFP
ncbi:MAG: hypothetical protein K2K82_08300 [Muribaculaceae bacterium]|nr:hypothetical protein [Muribaculaceae bacterium]